MPSNVEIAPTHMSDAALYEHLRSFHDLDIITTYKAPKFANMERWQIDAHNNLRMQQIHAQDHQWNPHGMGTPHVHQDTLLTMIRDYARACFEAGRTGEWIPSIPDAMFDALENQDAPEVVKAKEIAAQYSYSDQKIQAIKDLRGHYSLGLKEAKDLIDRFWVS